VTPIGVASSSEAPSNLLAQCRSTCPIGPARRRPGAPPGRLAGSDLSDARSGSAAEPSLFQKRWSVEPSRSNGRRASNRRRSDWDGSVIKLWCAPNLNGVDRALERSIGASRKPHMTRMGSAIHRDVVAGTGLARFTVKFPCQEDLLDEGRERICVVSFRRLSRRSSSP
jgi:hypothetical protein